jgi:hypothetical protein
MQQCHLLYEPFKIYGLLPVRTTRELAYKCNEK